MISKSFTLRVLVVSFLLLALPLLVDSFIFFQNSYYDAIEDAEKALRAEATERNAGLFRIKPVKEVYLSELAYILDLSRELENPDSEKLNQELKNLTDNAGPFGLLILQEEEPGYFKIISSTSKDNIDPYFISFRLLPKTMEKGKGSFVRYAYSQSKKRYVPFIHTVLTIKSEEGKTLGALMAKADIESDLNNLIERANLQEKILFAFLNFEDVVIAATDPLMRGQHFSPLSQVRRQEMIDSGQFEEGTLALEPLRVIQEKEMAPFFEFIFNDQVQIAYRAFAPLGELSLVSYSQKEAFFGVAVGHFLLIYTIYGIVLVLGAGVSYWLSTWVSRPLRQLSQLMDKVRAGQLDERFKEEPMGFDINILGKHFNHTLDNLLEHIQRAEDEKVKIETYQRELTIARQVQQSLLPKDTPQLEKADLSGIYLDAQAVGGTYFGYLVKKTKTDEPAVLISVVEASQEGISSCLYALSARGLFRTYATLYDQVEEILSSTNRDIIQSSQVMGMHINLFYGMYHMPTRILSYCGCGYAPGFVKRSSGEIVSLMPTSSPIGIDATAPFMTQKLQLESEDLVILYSEELLHSIHLDLLKNFVVNEKWKSAEEAIGAIRQNVDRFTKLIPRKKEVIIVALHIK